MTLAFLIFFIVCGYLSIGCSVSEMVDDDGLIVGVLWPIIVVLLIWRVLGDLVKALNKRCSHVF